MCLRGSELLEEALEAQVDVRRRLRGEQRPPSRWGGQAPPLPRLVLHLVETRVQPLQSLPLMRALLLDPLEGERHPFQVRLEQPRQHSLQLLLVRRGERRTRHLVCAILRRG